MKRPAISLVIMEIAFTLSMLMHMIGCEKNEARTKSPEPATIPPSSLDEYEVTSVDPATFDLESLTAEEEQMIIRSIAYRCASTYIAQDDIELGNFILKIERHFPTTDEGRRTLRQTVSIFCLTYALGISPSNYHALVKSGVAYLQMARITRRQKNKKELGTYLGVAKYLLGKAYMQSSGQMEPLYFLAEAALVEEEYKVAKQYLHELERHNYKIFDVVNLQRQVEQRTIDSPLPEPVIRDTYVMPFRKFRVGLLSFDETPLGQTIPAILLTELQNTGRFQTFEGGGIRLEGRSLAPLNENTAESKVDGYISGTFTKKSKTQVCFDVRLSNAMNHQILYAQSICISMKSSSRLSLPSRTELRRLALDIARSIKEIQAGSVIGVDRSVIGKDQSRIIAYIDAGREHGVVPGMVGYILGTGFSVKDDHITSLVSRTTGAGKFGGDELVNEFIVGSIYIVSVGENTSTGLVYWEGASEKAGESYVVPGDTVYFK